MGPNYELVQTLANGGRVYVRRGERGPSLHDFHVSYLDLNRRRNDLPHKDIVLDVYRKRERATPEAFNALLKHMLRVIRKTVGVEHFPPAVLLFTPEHVEQLDAAGLGNLPGYDLELLLVAFELIQIQEETRVKNGRVPTELFTAIRDEPKNLMTVANLTIFGYRESRLRHGLQSVDDFRYLMYKYRERDDLLRRLISIVVEGH